MLERNHIIAAKCRDLGIREIERSKRRKKIKKKQAVKQGE